MDGNQLSIMSDKLKTGVLGLKDRGQALLEVVSQIEHFQIQAVADKDGKLAEKIAGEYECASYDDYRQLIMQNQLDCLVVAAGIHSCDEYVRAAMKKKFNVLKLAPAARNFEETAEFVRLAEDKGIKFSVLNPGRFSKSFIALKEFIEEGLIEHVSLITAHYAVGEREYPAWQSDKKLSGGGVLLHNCYELIDQIVLNFGVPEQVYSLNTNTTVDKQQRLYMTEDTAVVTMRFNENVICNLTASKAFGPEEGFLKVYGSDKILTVSDTKFVVSDIGGEVIEESNYNDGVECVKESLENFALSILQPEENQLCSGGRENLKNMSVIESAYLSARTGMAEEPGRILQLARPEAMEGQLF